MKIAKIKTFLRPYSIYNQRSTTINHAFASAIAPVDSYNEKKFHEAMELLDQNPLNLMCAYCEKNRAETWDHANALVKSSNFSGFGHTIGNLIPCCKECNSKKGNKDWRQYITKIYPDETLRNNKIEKFEKYFQTYSNPKIEYVEIIKLCPDEIKQLNDIKQQIFNLMKEADKISEKVREKISGIN
jgi:endonuclease I